MPFKKLTLWDFIINTFREADKGNSQKDKQLNPLNTKVNNFIEELKCHTFKDVSIGIKRRDASLVKKQEFYAHKLWFYEKMPNFKLYFRSLRGHRLKNSFKIYYQGVKNPYSTTWLSLKYKQSDLNYKLSYLILSG
jgi:hypothetical protein